MADSLPKINWLDEKLYLAVALCVLKPIYWNVVARLEYHTKFFTKRIDPVVAVWIFALTIILFGFVRDYSFYEAIRSQEKWSLIDNLFCKYLGLGLIVLGSVLVMTSFWALGVTGTFLGDYFGILMDKRVTTFPFDIFDHPMYLGTTLNFLGVAVRLSSLVGVILSVLIWIIYKVAESFEAPFTTMIYSHKISKSSKKRR